MKQVGWMAAIISIASVTMYGVLIWLFGPALVDLVVAITEWVRSVA